jgi:CHAT domain-containing protein
MQSLPGTISEANAIQDILGKTNSNVILCSDEDASKMNLLALSNPYILHLATHAFYLKSSLDVPYNTRGMKIQGLDTNSISSNQFINDPMKASGIALSGAQISLDNMTTGVFTEGWNDGILSADEVATLDFNRTWLVTLSACDTGIGEVRNGEGVFGLRRAFMMSGTQNLLMTLWPVNDEVTPKIMADFYKEVLSTRYAAGALNKVQREWLVRLRNEKGPLAAVCDAGPFAMIVMASSNSKKTETGIELQSMQVPINAQENKTTKSQTPQQLGGALSNPSLKTNENKNPESVDDQIKSIHNKLEELNKQYY